MLPSLCAAFLAGLVAGALFPYFPVALLIVLLVLILVLSFAERAGFITQSRSLSWSGALCLGMIYWTVATPSPSMYPRDEFQEEFHSEYAGRIVSLVQHAPSRMTMLVQLDASSPGISRYGTIRLNWRDPGDAVYAGDQIVFRVKLHVPAGSLNPGGFDYASYAERQGIQAVGTVTGPEAVHVLASTGGVEWWWRGWGFIDRSRSVIREAAITALSQPALGIFLGIIIGERGYVAEEVQEIFMTTGTVHLLSISGSHLGLIALVVFGAIRRGLTRLPSPALLTVTRFLTPTRLAILGTWVVVTAYALLAGAELATMRAWIMICLAFAAVWIGSEKHLLHALAGAAVLILLHDPRAIGDISFQLSFLSVLAIIRVITAAGHSEMNAAPVDSQWRSWIVHVIEAVVSGAAVTVITIPLVAWYFNQVPWLGLITNLVAVPFTGIILVPVGLLSALVTLLHGTEYLPLAVFQQTLLEWMVTALHWCANWTGGDWRVSAPPLWGMVLFYLGVFLAASTAHFRNQRSVGAGLIALALGGWIWSGSPMADGDRWRVTFLDVGQGDSAVLQLPDGKTVLIDGGSKYERFDMGRGVIAPFLLNQGIHRVDHIVATHPQQDHVGGLPWVIRHLDVGEFWHTWIERPEPLFEQLRHAVSARKVTDHVAVRGQHIVDGNVCRLFVLNPVTAKAGGTFIQHRSGTVLNNESVVTQLTCGRQTVVFAADIETDGLRRLAALGQDSATVLKVPHHGARSSLAPEWIALVRPRYAVFSAGRNNSYGHPVPDVIEAYSAVGSDIARTDRDGAVIVTGRVSTAELRVRRTRDGVLRPVSLWDCLWTCERDNWSRVWMQAYEF